jgi:acetyltransferase-like isoleucine patch superfamily enzyme
MGKSYGTHVVISSQVEWKGHLRIGHCSIVGIANGEEGKVTFGENVTVGNFCNIESGVEIGSGSQLANYSAVYAGAKVGCNVKLLHGISIYSNAVIGNDCIIGGDIAERCVLEDRVTFMGEVAHSHHDASSDWDTTDEPSPIVECGSVIGVNAILIGGIRVGRNCYVSSGEVLRHDLPANKVFIKGTIMDLSAFKGLIVTRYELSDRVII